MWEWAYYSTLRTKSSGVGHTCVVARGQEDMLSLWLRLVESSTLTTMWFLASTVRSLQWFQGLLGSSTASPGPVTVFHRRQQLWPKIVVLHACLQGPASGACVVAGAFCRHTTVVGAREGGQAAANCRHMSSYKGS